MLSQPVIKFTPIRALHGAVVRLPESSCIESSRLFHFSCSTFSKSSFCYEQAVGQRHQCQCIRVHHTVVPACIPGMENNTRTRISLFVTELYLRNRVSDHHVSASGRPTGLSFHTSMTQLPSLLLNASVLPLLVLALSSSFHDFTV